MGVANSPIIHSRVAHSRVVQKNPKKLKKAKEIIETGNKN